MLTVKKFSQKIPLDLIEALSYNSFTRRKGASIKMETATNDPLLDELNGALSVPTSAEDAAGIIAATAAVQPPALMDTMDTGPKPSTTAPAAGARARAADKSYAKAAGGFGYRVTVEGEYYAKSSETKGNVIKKYKLGFNLPSLTNAKGESALGIIVGQSRPHGGMLKLALMKMDPLAITARTHRVQEVVPLSGAPEPTNLMYANFETLKKYVEANLPEFPIPVDRYWDANHLRDDILDFKTNMTSEVVFAAGTQGESHVKGGFGLKKSPAERITERHEAREEEKELLGMNQGLEG